MACGELFPSLRASDIGVSGQELVCGAGLMTGMSHVTPGVAEAANAAARSSMDSLPSPHF
jgi:hypothetical protein